MEGTMSQSSIGSVVSLRRYPVKSMLGEQIDHTEITDRGLLGDRAYALQNVANGKVISAKYPRKWGRMFQCAAAFVEPPRRSGEIPAVTISLPDGRTVSSGASDADEQLSRALDGQVKLLSTVPPQPMVEYTDVLSPGEPLAEFPPAQGAPAGSFFDYAPLHLLATSTLQRFQTLNPAGRFDARRFRPNILIDAGPHPDSFVELEWVGRTLAIGEVLIRIIDPTPRCVMTTLPQGDLPHDPSILRTAVEHNRVHVSAFNHNLPCVGVYGTVLRGGTIRSGDPIRIE